MTWHLTILSIFIVGISVFLVSNWSPEAAWWYVIILLLAFMLIDDKGKVNGSYFASKLYEFGFPKP